MAITFVRDALLKFNGTRVSDHNRSELSVDVERIGNSHRMANGTMRKYWVADKRTFSCSWDMLPTLSTQTVDGFMGAAAIENFYNTTTGPFTLTLTDRAGVTTTYTVVFTEFSKEIQKRWAQREFWSVNISLEEV